MTSRQEELERLSVCRAEDLLSPRPQERPACGPAMPHGLMSLWDMVNLHVATLSRLSAQLMLFQIVLGERPDFADSPRDRVPEDMLEQIRGWFRIARLVADDFEIPGLRDRIDDLEAHFGKRAPRNEQVAEEMRGLRAAIDAGLKSQLVFRYPTDKASVLMRWQEDWAAALNSFPSAANDIRAGVDLWALGHATASVFQFMRVLEHGLRALAADVGRTFDIQNWQAILEEIEAEVRREAKALPRGAPKNERLQFLSEAVKEFVYFKDGWRNYVSHGRGAYEEGHARSVMEHVRSFMTALANRLSEAQEDRQRDECAGRAANQGEKA